jgi:hypothetical protein
VEDSSFVDCAITGGRIDYVTFLRSTFKTCTFQAVKAATIGWGDCLFEDVTFSGVLVGVQFQRSTFRGADFSAAELKDSMISDLLGGDVKLPDRPSNFTVSPDRFPRAEAVLRDRLDDEMLDSYKRFAKAYGQMGPIVIISDEMFPDLGPKERQLVLATLYELRKG